MGDLEFLNNLCFLSASSGSEKAVQDFLEKEFGALSLYTKRSGLGDLIVTNYEGEECDILFDAHSDQVGFIVTEVLKDGFLRIAPVGSPDPRAISALRVVIDGKEQIEGVITTTPPHLGKEEKLRDVSEVYVDTARRDTEELVSVSDRVHFKPSVTPLLSGKIAATGLDNKISILVLYMAAKKLMEIKTDKRIAFGFSGREEVGLAGAKAVAETVNPRRAVIVDVSFGFAGGKKEDCGTLGVGPMIGFSPVLSERLSKQTEEICKKYNIPSQREVMHSRTGTDADAVSISGNGVETVTVSIPIFGMHTPAEVVDIKDVKATAELLVKMISDLEG